MIKGLDELEVITLFVEDVPAAKDFYQNVLGLEVIYEDADSAVVKLQNLLVNLLTVDNAPTLVAPSPVGAAGAGARLLLTIAVENADATCEELEKHGVRILNGPIDRPWGRRTAAFADPAGNVWEIAQVLPDA